MTREEQFIAFYSDENTKEVIRLVKGQAINALLDKTKTNDEVLRLVDNLRAVFDINFTFEAYAQQIMENETASHGRDPRLIV